MVSLSISAFVVVTLLSYNLRAVFGWWSEQETAKVNGLLLGAPTEMTPKELHNAPVQQAAQFAVQQLNFGRQPGEDTYVLVKVVSGTEQVSFQ